MPPIIGIACPKQFFAKNPHEPNFYVSNSYIDGVVRSGGTPLLLPLLHQPNAPLQAMVEALDGLIFTGGEDPAPHLYGEQPLPGLGEVDYERDLAELALIRIARELKKPMLGICRGMQIINVALGGTLVQDIPSQIPHALQHGQKGSRLYAAHSVSLAPGFVRDALGKDDVLVNTSHHQSVKEPAPGLRVTAVAPDGVIEAIENDDATIVGIQWHPERMWLHDDNMLRIAASFVELAGRAKAVR
ncbi:gamma-glutamyl-gamma-aminobutyrate hydrolase family protein [Brevibacillus fluminis]|uniref:gamma-glutamyl-gamma-aminobutyrate hydrolase family protein n=1 Tax=Brevibacillus fluminis TaxID=511487 RepID=UPI003F889EF6